MPSVRSLIRYATLLCCCLAISHAASAQSRSARQAADSLKRVIADYRLRIHQADSIGDARAGIDLRSTLAVKLKPKEAVKLMEEAVMLADSAGLRDERLSAREELAVQLFRSGDRKGAYERSCEVAQGRAELMNDRGLENALVLQRAGERWQTERDSVELAWNERLKAAEDHATHSEADAERWMWIAIGAGALLLIVILFLIVRSSGAAQRTKKELAEMRAEIEALKTAPRNRLREVAPTPIPLAEAPPVVVTEIAPPPEVPVVDPQVLAFLRKMAPERLEALRDARARGDHEKVVRVVHTLKPHLTAVDGSLFADLCAVITAKGTALGTPAWNANVDRLEKEVERMLA